MKKTILYLFTIIITGLAFYACDDPYADQPIAAPTTFPEEELAIQDATFKVNVVNNPLQINAEDIEKEFEFVNIESQPELLDSTARIAYKVLVSTSEDFDVSKEIPVSYNAETHKLMANYNEVNDTVKSLNGQLGEQTFFTRVLAYVVSGGTKALYTTENITLNIVSYNYPPTAVNDTVTAFKDQQLIYDVLANDTDAENDQISLVEVGKPANGEVTFSGRTIFYKPNKGYVGADKFAYTISDGNSTSQGTVIITVTAMKQYFETTVNPWYIVGLGGNWNNSIDGLGSDLIPLDVVKGYMYNEAGDGQFEYTGYFSASTSFKLIHIPGNWDIQWGNKDAEGIDNPVMNDGGAKNFKVPTDGYYTIKLNSINNTLSITPAVDTPDKTYEKIGLIGEMTSWGSDIFLTANESTKGHTWFGTLTLTADSQLKFRANSDWGQNWGTTSNMDADIEYAPVGIGVHNGKNLIQKAGNYTVLFNDISGCYYFVKK